MANNTTTRTYSSYHFHSHPILQAASSFPYASRKCLFSDGLQAPVQCRAMSDILIEQDAQPNSRRRRAENRYDLQGTTTRTDIPEWKKKLFTLAAQKLFG